LKFKFKLKM